MKVALDCQDMARIFHQVRDDLGAYFAGVEAEKSVPGPPWGTPPGAYTEAILKAIAKHYESKAKEERQRG
jgi:hypothetical protein